MPNVKALTVTRIANDGQLFLNRIDNVKLYEMLPANTTYCKNSSTHVLFSIVTLSTRFAINVP